MPKKMPLTMTDDGMHVRPFFLALIERIIEKKVNDDDDLFDLLQHPVEVGHTDLEDWIRETLVDFTTDACKRILVKNGKLSKTLGQICSFSDRSKDNFHASQRIIKMYDATLPYAQRAVAKLNANKSIKAWDKVCELESMHDAVPKSCPQLHAYLDEEYGHAVVDYLEECASVNSAETDQEQESTNPIDIIAEPLKKLYEDALEHRPKTVTILETFWSQFIKDTLSNKHPVATPGEPEQWADNIKKTLHSVSKEYISRCKQGGKRTVEAALEIPKIINEWVQDSLTTEMDDCLASLIQQKGIGTAIETFDYWKNATDKTMAGGNDPLLSRQWFVNKQKTMINNHLESIHDSLELLEQIELCINATDGQLRHELGNQKHAVRLTNQQVMHFIRLKTAKGRGDIT